MPVAAVMWSLLPLFAFGFGGDRIARSVRRLPPAAQLLLPGLFSVPYGLLPGQNRAAWLALYLALPILVAFLLRLAQQEDPQQRGHWLDFAVLFGLGLAVDLRWLESAWPPHFGMLGKLMLLDTALYGFTVIRPLANVGFDLRIRGDDVKLGLRELIFYAPIAVPLGLVLGFLHWHGGFPPPGSAATALAFTFFFIALPEEIYFRGWLQNLLERRMGARTSLCLTSLIFGLSHFNKRAAHFNWRYVVLATLAGIFYGRAWRQRRRVAASAITHTLVDAIWSLWLQ